MGELLNGDNPATRLWVLLASIHQTSANTILYDAWKPLLFAQDRPEFLRRYASALELPDLIEERAGALNLDGTSRELLLLPLKPARQSLRLGFEKPVAIFCQVIDSSTLARLEMLADRLRAEVPDPAVASEELEKWHQDIRTLFDEVLEADLPTVTKRLLLRLVGTLENALRGIRISGVVGVNNAAEAVIGGLIVNQAEVAETGTGKEIAKKLGQIAAKVLLTVTLVHTSAQLPGDIAKLLELGSGSSVHRALPPDPAKQP